jgi:hypothetical protein
LRWDLTNGASRAGHRAEVLEGAGEVSAFPNCQKLNQSAVMSEDFKVSDDTRIAPGISVRDWKDARARILNGSDVSGGIELAVKIMRDRLQSRFISPIEKILENDSASGEGFAAVALMCMLVEFVQSMRDGKIYRTPLFGNKIRDAAQKLGVSIDEYGSHLQPNEYRNSKDLFVKFLAGNEPFRQWFNGSRAEDFYASVRCGLMHEAATKGNWLIRQKKAGQPSMVFEEQENGSCVLYRTPFFEALKSNIESYLSEVSAENSYGLLLKCDHLAGIKRVFYYAYGSNMLSRHMRKRRLFHHEKCWKSVLHGSRFTYDKRSMKGGTCANLISAGSDDYVEGVVYEIDESDLNRLHESYEIGYEKRDVWLTGTGSKKSGKLEAVTFISEDRLADLPRESYVNHVVAGARERGLDEGYIRDKLEQLNSAE